MFFLSFSVSVEYNILLNVQWAERTANGSRKTKETKKEKKNYENCLSALIQCFIIMITTTRIRYYFKQHFKCQIQKCR